MVVKDDDGVDGDDCDNGGDDVGGDNDDGDNGNDDDKYGFGYPAQSHSTVLKTHSCPPKMKKGALNSISKLTNSLSLFKTAPRWKKVLLSSVSNTN